MSDENIIEVEVEKGHKVKIFVRNPTRDQIAKADMLRAKRWNECIMEGGILTKKELDVLLEKRGIWTKKEKGLQEDKVLEIGKLEKDLYLSEENRSIEAGKELAIQIRKKRLELRDLLATKVSMEANTAEALADNARFDHLVSQCLYDESNTKKIYSSLEEYNQKADDPLAAAGAAKLAESMYGLDREFEANLPENNWLRTFELVDEDLNIVNKEGQMVDLGGRRINNLGQYVDDDGNPTDKEGNPIDEHGNYMLDKSKYQTAPKKRGRSKKIVSGEE